MKVAFHLANLAKGRTSPNPPVGAVLVKSGEIIGKGYTQSPGESHAETFALNQANKDTTGSILYTTLEPCHLFGKVPPCTQAIIEHKVKKVYVSILDANPKINGRGVDVLRKAGIEVVVGEMSKEISEFYLPFAKFIKTNKPFVVVKFAMSLDGKIATRDRESKWITSDKTRRIVHKLRSQTDVVVIGKGTLEKDNPLLTARKSNNQPLPYQPIRLILSSDGMIPNNSLMIQQRGKIIVTCMKKTNTDSLKERFELRYRKNIEFLPLPYVNDMPSLGDLLDVLGKRGCVELLIEGGEKIFTAFFEQKLIDKIIAFIGPKIIGGRTAPTPFGGDGLQSLANCPSLDNIQIKKIGQDLMVSGYLTEKN